MTLKCLVPRGKREAAVGRQGDVGRVENGKDYRREAPILPEASVATAVTENEPAGTLVRNNCRVDSDTIPTESVPKKNST